MKKVYIAKRMYTFFISANKGMNKIAKTPNHNIKENLQSHFGF